MQGFCIPFCDTLSIIINQVGTYVLKAGLYGADQLSDSYYVKVDDAPAAGHLWDTQTNTTYAIDVMSDRNIADPVLLTLAPGEHTVTIYLREDGTRLDTVLLESVEVGVATTLAAENARTTTKNAMGLRGTMRLQSTISSSESNVDAVDFTTFSMTLIDSTTNGQAYSKTLTLGADGSYQFDNLPVGEYLLTLQVPEGYKSTMPEQMSITLSDDMVTKVSPDVLVIETRNFSYLPFLSIR